MFRSFIKSKVFQRYVYSYLIIFFVPFIVMILFIYHQTEQRWNVEIEQANKNKLLQASEQTYSRIKEMNQIAARITYDSDLTPYMVSHPYSSRDAIEKLGIYKSSTAIIDEILLFYRDSQNMYSDRGYYSVDTMLKRVLGADDAQKERFLNLIKGLKTTTVLPADYFGAAGNKRPGTMLFLCPIPPHDTNKHGTVIFFVKNDVFQNMIQGTLGDFEGNVYITNANNDMILSRSKDGELEFKDLDSVDLSVTGVSQATVRHTKYSVVTVHSDEIGWTFVTAMPTAQFFKKAFHFPILLLIIAVWLILTGLILALFFAIRQYRPVNRMQERMSVQKPYVRDQSLLKLLGGSWEDPDNIREVCAMSGIVFPYPYFYVIYVSGDVMLSQETKVRSALLKKLEGWDLEEAVGFGVELIHDHAVAVLINCLADDAESVENTVRSLRQQKTDSDRGLTMGVGGIYDDITRVHNSYIEASAATDYKLASSSGADAVVYFKPAGDRVGTSGWYQSDLHLKLTQSLRKGNKQAAAETLGTMMQDLKTLRVPIDMLRCYCFDIINIVFRAAASMDYANAEWEEKIVNFTSIVDLEAQLYRWSDTICRQAVQNKEMETLQLSEQIVLYIQEHFREGDCSLEGTAAHFKLSDSYLSRFIKEKTDITFMQYLWELRLDAVKKELELTDKPIRTIVQEVGYIDTPNFIRKFKKAVGLTPGEYRKQRAT
ncbi:helix-turn-helix domain-containing protein [Paenibacillus nasutitermitis]|uniref:AraC family transcriptional regulator n=1 Tax=Paenibacillus nasutitermitis TaxID=1652958 RepID=A0A916ZKT8_9BACL|nr:helix-turn-helix domain-containing protein [Paenibacillus nasutitermitis]GGE01972.1 AraC family transcriptional regulator [Paenibacillus nasutitermitis]